MSLGENSTVVLEGCCYVAAFLCDLRGFHVLWCKSCFWYECLSPLCSLYAAHYPLDRRCNWCRGDQSQWRLLFALWSSLPCQGQGLLPSWWSVSPWSDSELYCEVARTGVLPLGEGLVSILLPELFAGVVSILSHLSPVVWAHRIYCCWHCLQLCLNCGNASNQLWWSSGTVFIRPPKQIHGNRVLGVRWSCTWTCCGSCGAAQTLAWPCPCIYTPIKLIAAKGRATPAVRAPMAQLSRRHWTHTARGRGVSPWKRLQPHFPSHAVPGAWLCPRPCLCKWVTHYCLFPDTTKEKGQLLNGERGCNGFPALHVPLNNSASFLWQPASSTNTPDCVVPLSSPFRLSLCN